MSSIWTRYLQNTNQARQAEPLVLLHIVMRLFVYLVGRDSSVDIVIRHDIERPGIECHQGQDFPPPFRQAVGPTQPPAQWAPCLFLGCKAAGASL